LAEGEESDMMDDVMSKLLSGDNSMVRKHSNKVFKNKNKHLLNIVVHNDDAMASSQNDKNIVNGINQEIKSDHINNCMAEDVADILGNNN
jgi:hypothetical protein